MKKELDLIIYLIKWFILSLIIGVFSGSASAFFLIMLEWATKTREHSPFLIYFLPAGGFIVSLIYYFFGKEVSKGNNLILDEINNPKKETAVTLSVISILIVRKCNRCFLFILTEKVSDTEFPLYPESPFLSCGRCL